MHVLAVRKELYERHRWLPSSLLKAFAEAKDIAIARLEENSATKVTLPFVEERVEQARQLIGPDYWSYGFAANRAQLDLFADHHYRQGISQRRVQAEELFVPEALEMFSI